MNPKQFSRFAPFALMIFIFSFSNIRAQDTIIRYEVLSQTITEILPVPYDTLLVFDKTNSAIGSLGNAVALDLTPPTSNLFPGTQFTDIARAELFYDVTDYPIRTSTKLFGYKHDTLLNDCSGILVAPNFVLTAAHCVRNYYTEEWHFDSMLVAPALDNGNYQPGIGSSTVENYYIFKTFYDRKFFDDLALLQLKKPLGFKTGWVGIAFSSDTAYFNNRVFHKLSYPMAPNPVDTTRIYNGDTLYYNYGYIDPLGNFLGVIGGTTLGVPGQSGSSLFYTDNVEAYTFGVLSFSSQYRHTQITNNIFHQFENVILENPVFIKNPEIDKDKISLYPNPFSEKAKLEFEYVPNATYAVFVFNSTGELVQKIEKIDTGTVILDRQNLSEGLYFIQLIKNGKAMSGLKIIAQ